LRHAAAAFSELRGYTAKVALDDAQAFELDLYNVIVANGRYVCWWDPGRAGSRRRGWMLDIVLIAERGPADSHFGGPDSSR